MHGLTATMPSVYVCAETSGVRRQLLASLASVRARVAEVSRLDEIPRSEATNAVRLVLWEPSAVPELESLTAFRQHALGTQVVLCVTAGHPALRLLSRYAREGIDDLVLLGVPGDAGVLRQQVSERLDHSLPDALVSEFLGDSEERVAAAESYCLRHGYQRLKTDGMAAFFGVNRSTPYRLMRGTGEPRVHGWLALGRVLHVAYELDTTDFSVAVIARRLSFESPHAMSMFTTRHLGVGPVEARRRGAVAIVKKLAGR